MRTKPGIEGRAAIVAFALACAASGQAAAEPPLVRLQGGTTWGKLLTPDVIALVESRARVKLEVVANGTGRSLENLAQGKNEIAMVVGHLATVADRINLEKPNTIPLAALRETRIKTLSIVLAVHASNPIERLSDEQARALLTGKTTSWKDVGGPDIPVMVVLASKNEAARFEVEVQLLKGSEWAKDARGMRLAVEVPIVVGQVPGAIGPVPVTHLDARIKRITTDTRIDMPLSLVTLGEPAAPHAAVIAALRDVIPPDRPAPASRPTSAEHANPAPK